MNRSRGHFLAWGAAAAATAPRRARAAQFEFKCATSLGPDHPVNIRLTQMWAAIEQESGGRIHTQLFPNSELGSDNSTLTQLRAGAVAFFINNAGIIASVVPVSDILNLGFAFKDEEEALRVVDGPLGAYIHDQAAAKGLYLVRSIWNSGMYQLGSNVRPIRTPADVRDFKVRIVESHITLDLFKTMGASPLTISGGELYTALQTKVVDGESMPLAAIESLKLYEVSKYISLTNHQWSGLWLIANGDIWKSLPPDLQQIIERNNTKAAALEVKTRSPSMPRSPKRCRRRAAR